MRRAILAGTGAILLVTATLFAELRRPTSADVVITGRITAAETGAPLAGARVGVDATRRSASTGPDGRYRLALPQGVAGRGVVLIVTANGHEPRRVPVEIASEHVTVDVALRAAAITLDPAVVTSTEARARQESASADAVFQAMDGPLPPPPPPVAQSRAAGGAIAGHPMPLHPRGMDTEEYDYRADNEFLAVAQRPLSTFSVDVDRASYGNVRRFLLEGQRPPEDAVRVEEMINYFPYAYPEPSGDDPFSVTIETSAAPWRPEHRLVRIGLRSAAVDVDGLPPSNLVFLIDVSGSMAGPDRLQLVQRSLRMLVEQLMPEDRVAIVVYAGSAGLVLPSTPGSDRRTILEAIDRLEAGGSTAGGAGLRLAYEVAREHHVRGGNNRVILATDGDFNVGMSSNGEMVRLIQERRDQGTHLTVLGFGRGNLNDSMMQQIAQHGNGNYSYIDSLLEARKALVEEMGGTLVTVASDVKLQVEFNPERVAAYRLIGYENRLLADQDFNDDTVDAGEIGAGHTVTALYEVVPAGIRSDVLRYSTPLRYGDGPDAGADRQSSTRAGAGSNELAFLQVRYKRPGADRSVLMERPILDSRAAPSAELTFVSAVAGFGMLLRDSPHRGELEGADVLRMARAGRGSDPQGYRAEFVRLVELFLALPDRGHAHGDGR